jgi:tyrosyl-tRNA synthetase
MLYPLMQGYDSVAVKADVELGGTDQRFNLLAGRHLQPLYGQTPQNIVIGNLIMGLDGRKMSSSWGNTINVTDTPNDMFGKTMRLSDDLIISYLEHCTPVPEAEIKRIVTELRDGNNPRDAKIFLAKALVTLYHSAEAAEAAEAYFVNTFSKGELPEDALEVKWEKALDGYENLESFLVRNNLASSKSDARRKIEQGGVYLEGERIIGVRMFSPEDHGKVLQVGKKNFVKIVFSD